MDSSPSRQWRYGHKGTPAGWLTKRPRPVNGWGERAKIIIAAAGGEAELLMYGWMRGDDVDRRKIELLLARLPDGSQYEKWLRRIARHLARRHRVTIERVADVLAEKLELTGSRSMP